jgi:hypothetical protein
MFVRLKNSLKEIGSKLVTGTSTSLSLPFEWPAALLELLSFKRPSQFPLFPSHHLPTFLPKLILFNLITLAIH